MNDFGNGDTLEFHHLASMQRGAMVMWCVMCERVGVSTRGRGVMETFRKRECESLFWHFDRLTAHRCRLPFDRISIWLYFLRGNLNRTIGHGSTTHDQKGEFGYARTTLTTDNYKRYVHCLRCRHFRFRFSFALFDFLRRRNRANWMEQSRT